MKFPGELRMDGLGYLRACNGIADAKLLRVEMMPMSILFWYFPYIVFSAACELVLRPPEKAPDVRPGNAWKA